MPTDPADPIAELLTSYAELNPAHCDEFFEPPSALEFMRYVAKNIPFVVRGGAADWPAIQKWNTDYLKKTLSGQMVNVAVTPLGNADSPVMQEDGSTLFVKPWEEDEMFGDFLDYVVKQEQGDKGGEVRYAQTQNDNLRGEYEILFSDVEKDISWARIALEKKPEAINLWIGNSKSVTALHRDPYENIYCQVLGQKHFVLLPPLTYPCINEQHLKPAHYVRKEDGLEIEEESEGDVPFATWDPDSPMDRATNYSSLAQPIKITLGPTDMLYLPALWYHKVSQSCSEEGLCVAVNYWHDMEFGGSFFPATSFVRNVARSNPEKGR